MNMKEWERAMEDAPNFTVSTGAISKEEPAMIRAVQLLDRRIGDLEKLATELRERLGRVLKPCDPQPENERQQIGDSAEYSELTTGIRNRCERLSEIEKSINEIIGRLEV